MTKGIVLFAFGKRGYGFAAWNLVKSIRYFNKTIPITILHDSKCLEQADTFDFHTDLIDIDKSFFIVDNRLEPANVKINMYEFLPYDLNLYLDVDAMALQDPAPILDEAEKKGGWFYTHVISKRNISQGRENPDMLWAFMDDIYERFALSNETLFPATNSSFQIVKKCEEAKAFFDNIKKNFENRFPIEKLRMKWGGGQPDELYLNIALAQNNLYPDFGKDIIFFGSSYSELNLDEIESKYVFLSMYGTGGINQSSVKLTYREWYDRKMAVYCEPERHMFKSQYIMQDKWANNYK